MRVYMCLHQEEAGAAAEEGGAEGGAQGGQGPGGGQHRQGD